MGNLIRTDMKLKEARTIEDENKLARFIYKRHDKVYKKYGIELGEVQAVIQKERLRHPRMKVKDIVTAAPALQEFGVKVRAIQPTMTDPDISREDKRITLNVLVESLSERTFNNSIVLQQIMTIINMKKEICDDFADTKSQVEGIYVWCPRMKAHEDVLSKEVEKHRKEYGLKV